MRRRAAILAVALLIGLPALASAQNAVVTGVVRSDGQLPVGGALVNIAAANASAVTNDNGIYRIVVPAAQVNGQTVSIEASSIGYRSQTQQITLRPGAITQNFTLAEQAIQLDEVVVTGTAGAQERRAQAATVATVNASRLAQVAPVQTVAGLLQARTPGVVLRSASGTSGTSTAIRIRGVSSIGLSNEPLIFIDGIRMSGQSQQVYGVGGQSGDRLNDIKIEDIESMEIVKGPAAAALYGADANAGVINIITKKGRTGSGFTQTINVEYGEASPNFTPEDNYARCLAGNAANAAFAACRDVPVGTVLIDNPLVRERPFTNGRYRNLNWNLRGGGERYTVFMSLGADDDNGTLPNNEYGHLNSRTNFGFFAHEKLNMEVGFGISMTNTQLPQNDNNIYGFLGGGMLGDPRTVGGPKNGWYGNNRPAAAIASIENVDRTLRFQPRVQVAYSPMTWFTHRLTVGGDLMRTRAYSFWAKNDTGFFDSAVLNTGQIGEARRSQDRITGDYLGNISRRLMPDLRADLSFGAQAITNKSDLVNATGTGLVNNDVRTVNSASILANGGQSSSENRSIGTFAQARLNWMERVYFNAAVRRDQASTFGIDTEPFYSPSVGLAYVISEEPFFENWLAGLPEGAITTLRLRAAWGMTGRQPTSGARSTFSPSANQISATQVVVGVRPGATGNPALKPERGVELEMGFDLGLLNDRLGFEITHFNKQTKDQVLSQPIPGSLGSSAPSVNIGSLLNRGWEIGANVRPITRENVALEFRLSANTLHNELLDLGTIPETQTMKVGFPLFGHWQYAIRSVDLANNRVIVSDTMEFLGKSANYPGYEGVLSATMTLFRDLSFYAQADRRGDFMQYDNTSQFRDRQNGFTAPAVLGPVAYGTNPDGTATDEAKIKWMRRFGCIPANYGQTNQQACPAWVTEDGRTLSRTAVSGDYRQDASFTRLREASVTYRVPSAFVQQFARAQTASVSLAMRNIRTWTAFDGMDPETDQFLTVPADRRWTVKFFFTF
jgi:TonB-dependent starch-binding outer membrane protein SusC